MNHFFIPLFVCLFALSSTTSLACKEGPDYNFEKWLKLNDKELQRRNCEREQIKLRMFSHNNDTKKVIESGKKLRKNHILDKTDLNYEAHALYAEKRYDEALGVFLLSQDSLENCRISLACGRKDQSVFYRYLLYKYYLAANRNVAADVALKEANIEYKKRYRGEPDLQKIFQWLQIEPLTVKVDSPTENP